MKNRSFKYGASALVAAVTIGLSGIALAGDCGGNQCFDNYSGISLGGSSSFGGFGAGVFVGDEGGIKVEKLGSGMTDLKLNVAGDTCGIDCQSGTFTFNASAMEAVSVLGGAIGTQSGQSVSVVNEGGAFSRADFSLGKFNIGAPR